MSGSTVPYWAIAPSRSTRHVSAKRQEAEASKEEIDSVLRGDDWDIDTDPGLERATRDP